MLENVKHQCVDLAGIEYRSFECICRMLDRIDRNLDDAKYYYPSIIGNPKFVRNGGLQTLMIEIVEHKTFDRTAFKIDYVPFEREGLRGVMFTKVEELDVDYEQM